ncbi:MAG: flavodoxin family protein [Actinomycetia bacterium]|nr:flavodoxin family protein [Actinomycetes bacterium]
MKNQKILIINGSPRKNGNCSFLIQTLAKGANENGGISEIINLQELKISPCDACDACRKNKTKSCIIKDDMIPLYSKVAQADAIVFASPTYWANISAQTKLFIDRLYAVEKDKVYALTGKKIGIILTFGDKDIFISGGINPLRSFQDICAFVNASLIGIVYACAEKAGEIKNNPDKIQEAFELGQKLCL